MASVQMVFGMPVNAMDLLGAARLWPHLLSAEIALGAIRARKLAGTLEYETGVQVGLGDLPRELHDSIIKHLLSSLRRSVKYGRAYYTKQVRYCTVAAEEAEEPVLLGECGTFECVEQAYDELLASVKAENLLQPFLDCHGFGLAQDLEFDYERSLSGDYRLQDAIIVVPTQANRHCAATKRSHAAQPNKGFHVPEQCGCCGPSPLLGRSYLILDPRAIDYVKRTKGKDRMKAFVSRFHLTPLATDDKITISHSAKRLPAPLQADTSSAVNEQAKGKAERKAAGKREAQRTIREPSWMTIISVRTECVPSLIRLLSTTNLSQSLTVRDAVKIASMFQTYPMQGVRGTAQTS